MDVDRWQRLEPILDQILDLEPAERNRQLDRLCARDPELRLEVEQFLDECMTVDGFLKADTLELAKERALDQSFQESLVDRRFGPYRTTRVLGRGGMGTVLLAKRVDGHFEQEVAVKVVSPRRLDDENFERFRFERQILADLEHPCIAKLLDGGVTDAGMPFLVMDRVLGLPLDQHVSKSELSVEDRLRLLISICRAIDHAHQRRVVHLDLKPSNILVTADGEPKILDFGIAQMLDRRSNSAGSSSSGRLTPHFAAPEQLRGETVTSVCDVYSLGVVLYLLLTDRLPFSRESNESVHDFITRIGRDPAPSITPVLKHPAARELDAVASKALHKTPERRYGSAAELADDLRRVLDQKPVAALPARRLYHWRKHLQRHRWGWTGAALVLVALGALTFGWWQDRQGAQERLRIAQSFARQAEGIESFLRYAYALPHHDVRREKKLSIQRMGRIEEQMETLGEMAEGPGSVALGRAELMLRRPERALAQFERAWAAGSTEPEVAFAYGQALGQLYQRGRTASLDIRDPKLREVELERLAKAYRDPALDMLSRVEDLSEVASPALTAAMVALLQDQTDTALEQGKKAAEETPWLPDGLRLQGEAWQLRAEEHIGAGRWPEAQAASGAALEALGRAALLAPSDSRIADAICDAEMVAALPDRLRRIAPDIEAGLRACGQAMELDPDLFHARLQQAKLYIQSLQDPGKTLEERLKSMDQGLELARQALEQPGSDAEASVVLGTAHLVRAVFVSRAMGQDPRPDLTEAGRWLEQAVTLSPGMVSAHANRGTALAILAEEQLDRGDDPGPTMDAAAESFQEALDRSPDHDLILTNLSNLLYNRGLFEQSLGRPAESYIRRAMELGRTSIGNNPQLIFSWNLIGAAASQLGYLAVARGEPVDALLDSAEEALAKVQEINPEYPHMWINWGSVKLQRAWQAIQAEEDPTPLIQASLEASNKAHSLFSNTNEYFAANLTETQLLQLRYQTFRDRPVDAEAVDEAEQAWRDGLEVAPQSRRMKLRAAEWAFTVAHTSDDPLHKIGYLERARDRLEKLLERHPMAKARLLAVETYLWLKALGAEASCPASCAERLRLLDASHEGIAAAEIDVLKGLLASAEDGGAERLDAALGALDPLRRSELDALRRALATEPDPGAAMPGP